MKSVLLILTIGCFAAISTGYWGIGHWIKGMVGHSSAAWGLPVHWTEGDEPFFGGDPHWTMYFVSGTFGIIGLSIAAYFHLINRKSAERLDDLLKRNFLTRLLPRTLEKKWYLDEIYNALIRIPTYLSAKFLYVFDRLVIDGILVGGIARIPVVVARIFQPLQGGALQGYATTMAGGVALIAVWMIWVYLQKGGG